MSSRRKRHTPEQVVRKLQEADRLLAEGADGPEVARQLGVAEQTYNHHRPHSALGYQTPASYAAARTRLTRLPSTSPRTGAAGGLTGGAGGAGFPYLFALAMLLPGRIRAR